MLEKVWHKIKANHFAMMAVCCILPVIFIVLLKWFGYDAPWVYVAAIGICIGSHLVMTLGSKEGKTCH